MAIVNNKLTEAAEPLPPEHPYGARMTEKVRARAEAPKASAFLVGQFEKSLAANLGEYIANYDANLQRSGLGHN